MQVQSDVLRSGTAVLEGGETVVREWIERAAGLAGIFDDRYRMVIARALVDRQAGNEFRLPDGSRFKMT